MHINTQDLIIEVTRRCNMTCEHCLRGCAQNMDISDEILEIAARDFTPGTVTFTGGEPSLNVRAIEKYFALAEQYGNMPYAFFVATNGKANHEELAVCLLKTYGKMEEQELCGLALSIDRFHDELDQYPTIFNGLTFFRPEQKRHPQDEDGIALDKWVIQGGSAAENGYGCKPAPKPCGSIEDLLSSWSPDFVQIESLYIAANGNVISDCNCSYNVIDEHALCHVRDLRKEIQNFIKEESVA